MRHIYTTELTFSNNPLSLSLPPPLASSPLSKETVIKKLTLFKITTFFFGGC